MSHVPPPPPPPPPGYVSYGVVAAPVSEPRGLRTATVTLFAVSSAICLVLGLVAHQRGSALADFIAGNAGFADLDAADARVAGLAALLVLAQLASVIVLCLWSYRTVKNAALRIPGAAVSPGLACGGWFIPLGNLIVPWLQLRRAARAGGAGTIAALSAWQSLFVLQGVVTWFSRADGLESAAVTGDAVDILRRQGLLLLLAGAMLVAATVAAGSAMRRIDMATSGSLLR